MTKPLLFSLALALMVHGGFASTAKACGGFFCNRSQPVNQAAERIIFSHNEDGTTTAMIQILYSGPSENFAWMLPVNGSPDISVSSNSAFQQIQRATNPSYRLNVEVEGECDQNDFGPFPGSAGQDASFGADAGASSDAGAPPVTVVDEGSVGPYDFVIISVDQAAEDIALVATEWLQENEYDVSELGRDRLVPYLESGMNLLAFRLTKGRDTGEIRPVVLSFGAGLPSIPLRPTAAAATPDMGIMVFVLGESRAIPANYLDLELNEARLNWFNASSNYNQVVTQAANEAGGQGFVTEFAGDAGFLEERIFPAGIAERWTRIQEEEDDFSLLSETAFAFQGWDGLLEVFLAELTKPESISEEFWAADPLNAIREDYYNNTEPPYEGPILEGLDRASFAARMEAEVIAPVRETAELFQGGRTMTRLYTTMSPEEMTMDPVFDFNAELPDYSNTHTARQIIECGRGIMRNEAGWRVVLDNGVTIRGNASNWPLANSEMPAMATARRVGNTGNGEVIMSNAAAIVSAVNANNVANPRIYPRGLIAGGGCSVSTGSGLGGAGFGALLLLGAALWRRRRA
ncbi:MAG: DUF2330 domain-containing protein [Polyangiales bacterium]